MKKYLFVAIISLFAFETVLSAQNRFNNCSAVFLNQKLVVDDYSPTGKCVVKSTDTGQLTVSTATYDNDKWLAGEKISFKITLRDGRTKTMLSYSDATYQTVDIQKILEKCQKGDYILISIVKDAYALPHNEILVE